MWKSKNPTSFMVGLGVVGLTYLLKKPAHAFLIKAAQGVLGVSQQIEEVYHHTKEEIEDIIAEAHYEHMKTKLNNSSSQEEK